MSNKYSSITPGNSGRGKPARPGRAPRMTEQQPWFKRILGGAFDKPTAGKWLILGAIAVVALILVLVAILTTRGDSSAAAALTELHTGGIASLAAPVAWR